MPILLTEKAAAEVKEIIKSQNLPEDKTRLRVGVKGGGCSGFSYVIEFSDDPPRERDVVQEFDGVKFYVDKKSLIYLAGSVLDYEKTVMFQGFKFKNPQEASKCGCGHSFTVR